MADSDALRARRYRQHRQGDHSACRHGRVLQVSKAAVQNTPPRGKEWTPGLDSDDPRADFDPVTEMRLLAGRLAAAYAADTGNAPLARELRMTLLSLAAVPSEPEWDPIAEIQQAEWDSRRNERDQLA